MSGEGSTASDLYTVTGAFGYSGKYVTVRRSDAGNAFGR